MPNIQQNKPIMKKLSDLPYGTTVLDAMGREGKVASIREELQCGIYLYGWKEAHKYDWDIEVEVVEYPKGKTFIYLV